RRAVEAENARPRLARRVRMGSKKSIEHCSIMKTELLGQVCHSQSERLFSLVRVPGAGTDAFQNRLAAWVCFGLLHLPDLRRSLVENGLQLGLLGWLQPQRQILLNEAVMAAQCLEAAAEADEPVLQRHVRVRRAAQVIDYYAEVLLAAIRRGQHL